MDKQLTTATRTLNTNNIIKYEDCIKYAAYNTRLPSEFSIYKKKSNITTDSSIKAVLNKVSDSNYKALAEELLNLDIDTDQQQAKLAQIIFDKAISERKFIKAFINLCSELLDLGEPFKNNLLIKCQTTFEKIVNNKLDDLFMTKDQITGFFGLLGGFYNTDILVEKIAYAILFMLLDKWTTVTSHPIECICVYLKSIGEKFYKNNPKEFNNCFSKLDIIINNPKIATKDKFMIQDIIDFKKMWMKK